ncbi:flagellar biosynthesis protein FlhF [Thioalkalivibrio denitrificans]|uniref:Flagellar biosynthesis protein FlhF n=1 Tax=Thioalkalivibrio denitrificans TaxID=108003 RepID=A0A1V3NMM1_9GAMM|nr:flagellar biosynthesis protein FlhF [Thioalkalivibrio denitrificans]OOG26203.1 flagellar biosynthesis protein FlhF [Thioalkalivibrio denitrificans]
MKIRRFFAQDMRQALRLVRDEQGPDAVILSSRKVEGGIEIVAAVDYDQELVMRMAAEQGEPREPLRKPQPEALLTAVADEPEMLEPVSEPPRPDPVQARPAMPEVVWSQDPTLVAMQREIEGLRGMLQDQLASFAWNDFRRREPERVQIIRRLVRLGLDETLSREIAAEVRHVTVPDRAWREALYGLARRIPVEDEKILDGDGVIALVGPSGVGKTTTIAKLAARHIRRHGKHSVALVTTDAYRIGAYRQLQTFGQILGVPVHLAETGRQLGDILMGLGDKQRIFVDTAGMSQRDVRLVEELSGLADIARLRTLLVVAANAQQAVLEETFDAFGHLPLTGTVLTKVDEAASLGPVICALHGGNLPLVYVSEGQRVPEDLQPARVQRLVSRAVSLAAERRTRGATPGRAATTREHMSQHVHVQIQ